LVPAVAVVSKLRLDVNTVPVITAEKSVRLASE